MANARQWVQQMIVAASVKPLTIETIWKSLDKHVGQGPQAVARINDVLTHIDDQLIDRTGGPAMSTLWNAVADYLERTQEGLAAA